jgi:hypothetical protein
MMNHLVFDATQAEVSYRIDNLYQSRRNLQKRRGLRWFSRRAGVAQQPVQEQVRAPALPVETTRQEPVAKEKSEVSVG